MLASAELYDPDSGRWTGTGSMIKARGGHTATLLSDGNVLVIGGYVLDAQGATEALASAELYDPRTGTWTATASMKQARSDLTATLLRNGKVLVVGNGRSAELYDPGDGSWTATGEMNQIRGFGSTATLLPDGTVLVAGGGSGVSGAASAELYDPNSGTWTATGSMTEGRLFHTATLLLEGPVLVAGGSLNDGSPTLASAELYEPATGH
jgi:N-acetylneuraminic acid mutarotase